MGASFFAPPWLTGRSFFSFICPKVWTLKKNPYLCIVNQSKHQKRVTMITFEATTVSLTGTEETTVFYKTASPMKMVNMIQKLDDEAIITGWTMIKYLPAPDQWGNRVEWEMGNRGINAGAYLHGELETLIEK